MSKEEMKKRLEELVKIQKSNKVVKLLKIPHRILITEILKIIGYKFNKTFLLKTEMFWKDYMHILIPEKVSTSIYKYRFYEEGLTKMILNFLEPGMVFMDIGAHFGYYTSLSSKIVGDSGKVIAFEPTPSSFNILKMNSLRSKNIIVNNVAVGSRGSKILINDYGVVYSAWNSVYSARLMPDIKIVNQFEIDVLSIDEYVDSTNLIPNFIKIDAESYELEVLKGMQFTINRYKPIIAIEVCDVNIDGVCTTKEIINYMIERGYRPFEYRNGKISEHFIKETPYEYDNLLFLPNINK